MNDHAPKLWWDREKTLFHFARAWQEKIVRTSADHGATWSFNDVQQRESDWRPGGKGVRYPGIHALW